MPSQSTTRPPSNPDWEHYPFGHSAHPSGPTDQYHSIAGIQSFDLPTSYPVQDLKVAVNETSNSVQAVQPVVSEHSDTLHPPSAASPTFSFEDYLTPEFSSENPYSEPSNHTTPGADDIWQDDIKGSYSGAANGQQSFGTPPHKEYALGMVHDSSGHNYTSLATNSTSSFLDTARAALMTPAMSTASLTPERSLHPGQQSNIHNIHTDMTDSGSPYDRSRQRTASDLFPVVDVHRSSSQKRKGDNQVDEVSHIISPVVMVSTYNRGDSPARSQVGLARTLSKRSTNSRLGRQSTSAENEDNSSMLRPPVSREQTSWEDEDDDERTGVAPTQRDAETVPSINDLERQRELDGTRAEVEHWLATSAAGSPTGSDDESRDNRARKNRIRSRSAGTRFDAGGLQIFDDSHIPGPGALIDEVSTYYYSDDDDEVSAVLGEDLFQDVSQSPPAEVNPDDPTGQDGYFPQIEEEIAPDEDEPLPSQFVRRGPWQDPARGLPRTDQGQPPTSNAAMAIYDRQVAKFETASRAATWGTRRRLSDSDLASILDGSSMTRHLSLKDTIANRARARGSSILNSAKKVLPGRSGSFIKKHKQSSRQPSPDDNALERVMSPESEEQPKPRDSISSIRPALQRLSSRGKSKPPKSPPPTTPNAMMSMTGHLTVKGKTSGNVTPDAEPSKSPLLGALKRVRSKSEVNKSPKHTGTALAGLITKHGGPPIPMLASPLQMREPSPRHSTGYDDDMDEDGLEDEPGIKMDLPVHMIDIIPTLEGFKSHARELNPRLELYLVERIGHDQLKRFKKLAKNKVDHARVVQAGKCQSGPQCLARGGKATILPPRTNGKDNGNNYAQFKVAPGGESDNEEAGFIEGVVTPALFPAGIPLPPTSHLPAEFECPLCFQVKRFQKPSDWTKHVHEDVQPFSCTFPNCPEPKSFKRKADWVRHENERHRHLEWWKCSVQECNHVCYRKDNFVQHLVREHKMTEPKGKGSKAGSTRARSATHGGPLGQGSSDFWHLVDSCRKETHQTPRNEPCKFCGNVCSNWKKLSVHVGKHMEQIAMPVLQLAERQKVNAETVISPIEPLQPHTFVTTTVDTHSMSVPDHFPHSPYTGSAHSNHPGSSAGHSPAILHAGPQVAVPRMNPIGPPLYHTNPNAQAMAVMGTPTTPYAHAHGLGAHYPYHGYNNMTDTSYMNGAPRHVYDQGTMNQNMTNSFATQPLGQPQSIEGSFDGMTGMSNMPGSVYEPNSSPAHYRNTTTTAPHHAAYLTEYGPELGLSHDGLADTRGGHSSHGHTPGSTGHTDTTAMPYYGGGHSGSSAPGYY